MASDGLTGDLRYSAANALTFSQSGNSKDFMGSGFLIEHKGKTYAVTAKHVLLAAMDEGLSVVDINGSVSTWALKPFNEPGGSVVLGKLLNTNSNEPLDMKVLQDDWLLFEVVSNDSHLKKLRFADDELKVGDGVAIYGCTFATQKTCQQDRFSGRFVRSEDKNLLIKLEGFNPSELRGLSGAAVLNEAGLVVGIVSNTVPDKEAGGLFFAPFSIQPVMTFLNR